MSTFLRSCALLSIAMVAASAGCASPAPPIEAPLLPDVDRSGGPSAPIARGTPAPTEAPTPRHDDEPIDVTIRNAVLEKSGRIDTPDAALFRSATDAFAHHDLTAARKSYFELIKNFPSSPLMPYAYVAFADMFFDEARSDPSKLALAKQAYVEAIKVPPPSNEMYAYALHRAGIVAGKSGEPMPALDFQKKAIGALLQYREVAARDALLASARHEIVGAYANVGSPDKALVFFKAVEPETAPAQVLALGEEYARTGKVRETIATYEAALKGGKTDAACASADGSYKTLASRGGPDAALVARGEQQRQALCR